MVVEGGAVVVVEGGAVVVVVVEGGAVVVVELVDSAGLLGFGVSRDGGWATAAADAEGPNPLFHARPTAGARARPMVTKAAARHPAPVRTGAA